MNKRFLLPVLLVGIVLCAPNRPPAIPTTPTAPLKPVSTAATLTVDPLQTQPQLDLAPGTPMLAPSTTVSVANGSTRSVTISRAASAYRSPYALKRVGDMAIAKDGTSQPLRRYTATALPNDPQASQGWVTQANLSAAWDIPRGTSPTLLAIIDTGFALKHEEFAGRFYVNPGETGPTTQEGPSQLNCTDRGLPLDQSCNLIDDNNDGIVDNESGPTTVEAPSRLNCTDQHIPLDKSCNMLDNDGNGFINDVTGWDFAYNTPSVQAGKVTPMGAGTHHGTYTTGVAAASGNNGVGIAGVDWNTKILPIQALADDGSGNTVSVANAIDYAVARHANVISLSLGSTSDDPFVHEAVRRAVAAGIVVVAASGNDGCNCMLYPANYPEVVSVGALDPSGQPASFSSYGDNLKLLAPGVNLYTTDWQPGNQTSAYTGGVSGTSLATPIVAGLLTRLLSQQPTASAAQLVAALTENANHSGLTASVPHSSTLGYGTLDAGRSSLRMATAYSPAQLYSFSPVSTGNGFVYQCDFGTTPVYELSQNGNSTFTGSEVERQTAVDQGAIATLFNYSCLSQPHDKPLLVRSLDIYHEFRNNFSK